MVCENNEKAPITKILFDKMVGECVEYFTEELESLNNKHVNLPADEPTADPRVSPSDLNDRFKEYASIIIRDNCKIII